MVKKTLPENRALGNVRDSRHAANHSYITILVEPKDFKDLQGNNYPFSTDMSSFHTISNKNGRKSAFFLQIVLPAKHFFTSTSGKNVYTGKPGLPEQGFTTLVSPRAL